MLSSDNMRNPIVRMGWEVGEGFERAGFPSSFRFKGPFTEEAKKRSPVSAVLAPET